ncbi:LPP20 family lipoprotein [Sulfurimonas sp. SAG-AH-194-C21]|nr:LPP20 family lipoprotein [Sulfurimonas sp. SAG-AH-194-C21]MDF1883163.1 LPP20 family lipoprotein [Sulfurimonas sp. SAG-AH-194-C21]
MKYLLVALIVATALSAEDGFPSEEQLQEYKEPVPQVKEHKKTNPTNNVLHPDTMILVSVVGQGVAPANTISPAQAYALAKRAAMADAYRLLAEKINGVVVDGQDTVKNMVMQRSTVRTQVAAMIKNATLVETTFKEGLCEVELEVRIKYDQFF